MVIHLSLFTIVYVVMAYFVINLSSMFVLVNILSWTAGGIFCGFSLILIIRIRTDSCYLLRKWIAEDLNRSSDKEDYLRLLVEKAIENRESIQSRNIFLTLKGLSMKGDSDGALIQKVLATYGLDNLSGANVN
jgi:hypothetical protein